MTMTDEQAKQRLAENVTRLLEEHAWKAADLARATGENEVRISSILNARNVASSAVVARIADALDVSIDYLFSPSREKSVKSA